MKSLLIIFSVSLALYLVFTLTIYLTQRRQIYCPTSETRSEKYESFFLPVGSAGERSSRAGIRLKLWRLHPGRGPGLIYFGGNAEDAALNLDQFDRRFPGWTVYLVNYRGYGGSGGRPSEAALCRDAVAIFDALKPEHTGLAVLGRSLGSAVALHLAAARPLTRVALITPFASLTGVARAHYFFLPISRLLKDRYENRAKAQAVTAPVLVLIAENDEIIPRRESELLVEALNDKECKIVTIPGAGHNDLDRDPLYFQALETFFNRDLEPQTEEGPVSGPGKA